jgi:SAM-dependent methyltransferase
MAWAKDVFVRGAKLYELVLEGMWEKGEEDALAISGLLQQEGLDRCRVLDVPCGIGRVGIPLAQLGFSVTGVDYSPHLVKVANSKAKSAGVKRNASFVAGEMSRLHPRFARDSFDCAINVFTSIGYGSVQDDVEFFSSLRKVIRKGGLFVISGLRNRDYVVANPAQNIYEESEELLVLDSYAFDVSSSRERGTWRFYPSLFSPRARLDARHHGLGCLGHLRVGLHQKTLRYREPRLRRGGGGPLNQQVLLSPAHVLDLPLTLQRRGLTVARLPVNQLYRPPAAREPGADAEVVLPHAPLDVDGAPRVELTGAAQDHVDHPDTTHPRG